MKRLLSAETLKLRSTRSFYAITAGALALIAAAVSVAAALNSFHAGEHPGRDTLSLAGMALTFSLLLGVISITSEFRYGTITPALLLTPRRTPLLAAKVVALARVAVLLGVVSFGSASALALLILSSRDVQSGLDAGDVAWIIGGGTIASVLFAALGVGIGAAVRNQVGAIIAALCLLYAIEPLLTFIPGVGDAVQRFGLGGLASAVTATTAFDSHPDILDQVPAAFVLGSYALAAILAGAVQLGRRDVTA